jgi:hypothetical protein
MSTDNEIIVQLTAETAQLQAGMDAGAASVKEATDAMRASVADAMSQYAAFDAIQKGSIQTAEDLAAAQEALSAAQQSGAFSAVELGAKEAIVSAAMKNIGTESKEAAGAIDLITSNSRTMYSVSALVSDAMTGQFSRMRREVAAVGNETGLLGRALTLVLSPAGLVAVAIAGIAAAAISAKDAIDKLATSAAAGGGMAGLSKDQLEGIAQGFKQAGYDVATARSAIDALSASGRVASDSIHSAAQASLDLAKLTGTDADKIAAQLSRLGTTGMHGILSMDEQYHFLNDSQREHIALMFQQGQATEGVKEAFDALAASEHARVESLRKDQGDVEGFWARMGTHIANAWDSTTKTMHMGLTDSEQLAHLDKVIEYQKHIGSTDEYINGLLAQRAALMAKIAAENKAAAEAGLAARHGADQDAAMMHKTGDFAKPSGNGAFEKKLRDEEAAQKISYDHRAQFEMAYWGEILQTAKAGSAEYTLAWTKTQELQKQLDTTQLEEWKKGQHEMATAARKAATEASKEHRKMAQEALTGLEMQRAGVAANTAERIRADAEILSGATKLYGAMSSQQHAALNQMLADEKSYDASVRALSVEKLASARDASIQEIANKRSQYQLEYSEGKISAERLLQLEEQLAAQKLAVEKKYYQDKEKLDAGDPVAIARDEGGIVKAQRGFQAAMTAAEREYHNNSVKEWQGYAKKVEGAMQGAINGMLFQHQTLRQGIANISLVIGEDFIKEAVMKPVDAWISGEATKTAAAIAGATQRAVITDMAAQRSKVADALTGKSQITSAAATGAAKAYQAVVGIPVVGPILAPIAAGVAFAGIEEFGGKLSSARGGWSRVPYDGAMTELHVDEKVLPAKEARGLDRLINGGGQGGGNTFNIHANDAKSFKEMMRRDPAAFAAVAKLAHRRGHFGGMR